MTNQPDKAPPHDLAAENSVVAAAMVDESVMDRIEALVAEPDFRNDPARWAFGAARDLWRRGEPVNQVTVAHELARADRLDDAGGMAFLARIVADLPTPVGVEHYAKIVRRDARYRRAITAGASIVKRAYEGGADYDGFLAECERQLATLQDADDAGGFVSIAQLLDAYWSEPGIASRETRMVRTGLMDLDALLAGIHPSNFVVVAAQTGHGKSTLLLNVALNAARGQNFRVAIFSLEMSADEWKRRLLAHETGLSTDRLRLGGMSEREEAITMAATGQLAALSLYIHDRSVMTVDQMRAQLRSARIRLGGLDLVLVDYLQLIGTERKHDNRAAEVAAISRGLKMLARELDVPVIAAAQLSREVDRRPGGVPRLSDLRESGAIEQDADAVIFLYRRDRHTDPPESPGVVKLIVAKHRHGPTGQAFARIDDATARMTDLAALEEEPAEYQEAMPAPWARN